MNMLRRDFLKTSSALSAGLVVGFHLPSANAQPAGSTAGAAEVNAWIHIHPDDTVVLKVARSEMGQGSSTALPQLIAEELGCAWDNVRIDEAMLSEHIRRNRLYVSTATGGSRAIRESQSYLRQAGATARVMLVQAAANEMGVPAADCEVSNGVVYHGGTGQKRRFGEVAVAASKLTPPKDVPLKDPKTWKLIGQSIPRFDIPNKVNGTPQYGIDVQLPGMLHAAIVQSPVFGGKVKTLDDAAAKASRGITQIVNGGEWVAVVGDNWWRCNEATKKLKIDWDEGGNGKVDSAEIRAYLKAGVSTPTKVGRNDGDFEAAFKSAAKTFEAEYYVPYLDHTPMEPMNCTALVKDGKVTVWLPTQSAEASAATAAAAAGVQIADIEVYRQQLGGGFGRRGGFQDFTRQAVTIAKAVPGRPVKLLWSREQDIQHGHYRPATVAKVRGAVDASGRLVGIHGTVAVQSILERVRPDALTNGLDPQGVTSFADSYYDIPNTKAEWFHAKRHVPVGFWRSVSHSQNPMFRECFIDEVCAAVKQDPYQYRRAMLVNMKGNASVRDLGILDATAKAAKWSEPMPANWFRGIAVQDAYGSHAAAVVFLEKMANGALKIRRCVIGVDPGYVANEGAAKAQIEGCMVYALTAALWGEITIKDGRVQQSNFHDWRMMKLSETPECVAVLAPTGGFWGGMGEPPMAPLVPAICNAVFAATGKPVRELPLSKMGLVWA
jgi:isoquinoline 1-oxidoreductase subunit beta